MRVRIVLLSTVVLMAAGPARAGYKTLFREWRHYEPAALNQYAPASRPSPSIQPMLSDGGFNAQVDKLKEIKKHWENALTGAKEEEAFYRADSDRLKVMRPSVTNPSVAEELLGNGFTLGDLETLAILRNPGIKASEDRLRATLETYSQVWNLDEILRQYTAFTEDLMTGVGPLEGKEPAEMKFPFPGVLALKGEVVTQEVKASREVLEIARRTAITRARKSYWDLLFVGKAQDITREMLGLLKHLERVAATRYETGKTNFQDLIKIKIERAKTEEDLKTLSEQQRTLEVALLELLDLQPTVRMTAPGPIEPDREVPELVHLYSVSLDRKQELRKLRAEVGKMERVIEMAETAIYPLYSLNLSLFQDEAVSRVGTFRKKEPFEVTTSASTSAGLPKMPWYGSNDAYLRETRQKLEALRKDLRRAENETFFRVREAWFRLDRAKREEALYAERVAILSQAALEVSMRGYETGKVAFADVIASYNSWLRDNLAVERRRSDLGISRAELEEAIGASLKE